MASADLTNSPLLIHTAKKNKPMILSTGMADMKMVQAAYSQVNQLNNQITMDKIAFIGDDINDLEVLKAVGFSALAGNSPIKDQFTPDYITTRHGGNGAFRDFADIILNAQ